MLVATHARSRDLKVIEQLLGLPCVLAGDAIYTAKNVERAQGNVAEVADWGRNEVETGC
jgi:hypothetical protein